MKITIPIEYKRLFDEDWREAAIWGGRSSMKSHTVARFLLIQARLDKKRILCCREYQNSINDSSYQLLKDLCSQYELTDFEFTNNSIINTLTGSDFLFKGLHHNEQSIKSIEGVDYCWVEEAQTISQKSIEILTPTVRKDGSKIIYTYNRIMEDDPIHKRLVLEGRPNTLTINVNYDVAMKYGMMPQVLIDEMEDDKTNRPALYRHKWLGEPINQEQKVYKNWNIIDEIPHEARLWRRGLDFGFTNDPSVLVSLYEYNGGYIVDEEFYQKGMSNKAIADYIANKEQCLVIADSSEPKSIDEMKNYGINIIGAVKGQGSVYQGIQFVQSQKISITKRSEKTIMAYNRYMFATDREGRILNTPDDSNHEWSNSMDAIRYGFNGEAMYTFTRPSNRIKRPSYR